MALDRPERSRREIDNLPPLDSTECLQHIRQFGHDLAPETLVFVLREAVEAGNTELVEVCGRVLTGTGSPPADGRAHAPADLVIRKAARRFGFDANRDALAGFWNDCYDAMWDGILAGRESKPFWEVNFKLALKGKCIDVGRPRYRRGRRELALTQIPEGRNLEESGEPTSRLEVDNIIEAIRRLPVRESHAAMLHWVDELPVDSASRSVSIVMGVSPSYVHRLLRQARQRLANDPVIRSLRQDF